MRKCRVFATDVDGTLTDGGMYYSEAGEVLKRFDTRDAAGMQLLRERGITLAVITSEDSPIVTARARKLGIEHVYIGVKDKYPQCSRLLEELQVPWEEFAYIGDDLGDLAGTGSRRLLRLSGRCLPRRASRPSTMCAREAGGTERYANFASISSRRSKVQSNRESLTVLDERPAGCHMTTLKVKTCLRRIPRFWGYDVVRWRNPLQDDVKLYERLYDREVLARRPFFNVGAGDFHHPYWTNVDKSSDWYAAHAERSSFHRP